MDSIITSDEVSINDLCDDLKNFNAKVFEVCHVARERIPMIQNEITIGFAQDSTKISKFQGNKISGWSDMKMYLLRNSIENAVGDGFQCVCTTTADPRCCTWNVNIRRKNS